MADNVNPTVYDGGPAFPCQGERYSEDLDTRERGMSLRDWFAGQALAGRMAGNYSIDAKWIAEHMYRVADAMLKARKES